MLDVHIQSFSYGEKEVLNQIDLHLPPSQIIGLVAPNGVGKSTLIQILSGHLRNNGILVSYQGKNYTTDTLFMRQHIVKMPDQSELYDELNGIEHLNFYASMWKVASGTVQTVIEQLKMEGYIHQKVGGYSLGMRQRLCFALVLVTKADYMLVDEVMNGLDPDNVELISRVLRQLRNEGKTVVMASHLLNNLDSIADKIYFMKEKRIALEYSPQKEGIDTLQLAFVSKERFEKFVEEFQREIEMMNSEERQLSIHLTPGEYSEEKWKWIFEDIHQFSEIKIGVKSCYALYKELYR
ncbi:ABC transporter ATP-binding protein [uncultured Granulicatella sp.]|uniref:ABC transporter ATP-binding protein n=1 Tax=uncultured Granulicatella sp. TaxID=316089 RepID=UPI00260E4377|nr:ABC transporter ATP-binding protein [uncultured Granulicatella sp.]